MRFLPIWIIFAAVFSPNAGIADMVFECTLEGGTHMVAVWEDGERFYYDYGEPGETSEMSIKAAMDDVEVLPENGAGPTRFGFVRFFNEGFTYEVFYSFETAEPDDSFTRGLIVTKDGETVFDKTCLAHGASDLIWELPAE